MLANALACAGNKIRELRYEGINIYTTYTNIYISLRNNLIGAAGAVALANCFQNENCRIRVLEYAACNYNVYQLTPWVV